MSAHLERLARRVASDPFFLAAPLARFAEHHHLDDNGLAAKLGCAPADLTHLRLCRSPDPMPPTFWNDVQCIATRFGIDPDGLAEVVRFGQVLLHLERTGAGASEAGYLMAARDREPEEGEQPEEPRP
jgi:hypothetical protein